MNVMMQHEVVLPQQDFCAYWVCIKSNSVKIMGSTMFNERLSILNPFSAATASIIAAFFYAEPAHAEEAAIPEVSAEATVGKELAAVANSNFTSDGQLIDPGREFWNPDPKWTLTFSGKVSQRTVEKLRDNLFALAKEDPDHEIMLRFDSGGGEVQAGLQLIDYIHSIPNKVHYMCQERIGSMAFIIFVSGASGNRYIVPSCYSMGHSISSNSKGFLDDMGVGSSYSRELYEDLLERISDRSGLNIGDVRWLMANNDKYFRPDELMELGFADEMLDFGEGARHVAAASQPRLPERLCDLQRRQMPELSKCDVRSDVGSNIAELKP